MTTSNTTRLDTPLIQRSKEFAIGLHTARNQMYGEHPYSFHLEMVEAVGQRYIHLLPEGQRESAIAGCWVHDVIEDTGVSYNDVKKNTSLEVAEIAFALTTPKGRTRAERHNDAYYQGIQDCPGARFVKVCDRIANITHSKNSGSDMIHVYRSEGGHFWQRLWIKGMRDMFQEMELLLKV